jgi:predicted site-specific integrase-resolvase
VKTHNTIKKRKNMNENKWLTPKQAMQLLQITSRTTLYRYAYKYHIRAAKLIGKVYFNSEDINALFDRQTVVF